MRVTLVGVDKGGVTLVDRWVEFRVTHVSATPPAAVTLYTPSGGDLLSTQARLQWAESADPDFDQYDLYLSTVSGLTPSPATYVTYWTSSSTTSYWVSGLDEATTYFAVLRVYNKYGLHADSGQISFTTIYGDTGSSTSTARHLVGASGVWSESLDWASDWSDYFQIDAAPGKTVTVSLSVPPGVNFDLQLYDSSGALISSSTNGEGQVDTITWTVTAGTFVYVNVKLPFAGTYTDYYDLTFSVT